MENQFLIPEQLRNALIGYLAQRPYVEVHQAIAALQSLQKQPQIDPQESVAQGGYGAL